MKFKEFRFIKDFAWFFLVPEIVFSINEDVYYYNNFRIAIHWLGWHCSWFWMEGEWG